MTASLLFHRESTERPISMADLICLPFRFSLGWARAQKKNKTLGEVGEMVEEER